jgi:hypothetical protein
MNKDGSVTPSLTPEVEKTSHSGSDSATIKQKFTFGLSKRIDDNGELNHEHMYSLTIGSLCETFSDQLNKLYENLDQLYEVFPDSKTRMDFYNMIRNNKEEAAQFVKIVYHRDKERQNRILQAKIDVSEKNLEMDEKITMITTWENRFTKLVKKYDGIKIRFVDLQTTYDDLLIKHNQLLSNGGSVGIKKIDLKPTINNTGELTEFPNHFPVEDSPKKRNSGIFDSLRTKFEKKEIENMLNSSIKKIEKPEEVVASQIKLPRKSLINLQEIATGNSIKAMIANNSTPGSMHEILEVEEEVKNNMDTQEDEDSTPGE